MTRSATAIFVVIWTQVLIVLTLAQNPTGRACCPASWRKHIGPIVGSLTNPRNPQVLNNSNFDKLFEDWNSAFDDDYFRGLPDDICNGILVYTCGFDNKCICNNDNEERSDSIATLEDGVCVAKFEGDFCDDRRFHKCKKGLSCLKNPNLGGKYNHCTSSSNDIKNLDLFGTIIMCSVFNVCMKIIIK